MTDPISCGSLRNNKFKHSCMKIINIDELDIPGCNYLICMNICTYSVVTLYKSLLIVPVVGPLPITIALYIIILNVIMHLSQSLRLTM